MEKDKSEVAAALDAARATQLAHWDALRALEKALKPLAENPGDDTLDGIDDLDLQTYDVDSIIEWAEDYTVRCAK